MNKIEKCTVELVKCALCNRKPQLPHNIDFKELYKFASRHGVENMVYAAIQQLGITIDKDAAANFEEDYDMAIANEAMQALELDALSETFEHAGIDYIPLKGSVVKYMYPMPDYRKSGDIDILIHAEDEKSVHELMLEQEYELKEYDEEYDVHAEYLKKPCFVVEIHRQLVQTGERTSKFCEKVWDYTYLKDGSNHNFCMRNEFLYTHLLAHICHHLNKGGAGIRLITDLYVMKEKASLNYDTLNKYIKKARLTELNAMLDKLILKWFYDKDIKDENVKVLENIILSGGSFGTKAISVSIRQSDTASNKIMWFLRRIFPPVYRIKRKYSIVGKYPFLLPFFWVYRFFDLLLFDRKNVSKKMNDKFDSDNERDDIKDIVKAIRNN